MERRSTRFERHFDAPVLTDAASLRHDLAAHFAWLGDAVDDAQVVVTELFTNAVRHGAAPVTVLALPFDGGVQLRVCDGGRHFGDPGPDSRGLQLIDRLATQRGIEQSPEGKAVWANILARP